jgi:RHS repeat-associated protein
VSGLNSGLSYTYVYDGNGSRVQKCIANPCISGSAAGTLYWIGEGGEVLDESDRTGTILEEYVYFNGQRISRRDVETGNVHYYFSNHLGSASLITDSSGNIQEQADYYPYGGIAYTYGGDINHYKFTGKERDLETGLDNSGRRFYASTMGRWMTPDPINLTSARLVNPANTLNKYVYGGNNPLKYLDKDGQDITIFYRPESEASGDFGHIFLGVLNQNTAQVAFLDFYPKGGTDSFGSGEGAYNLGDMQDRAAQVAAGAYATLTIRTTPDQAQAVIDQISHMTNGSAPGYSALSNNCTTTCQDVLHDLGLDFGDILPASYWADAYQKFSSYAQAHPVSTWFFGAPLPEAGREYGSPRDFGVNYRQLLFQMFMNEWNSGQGSGKPLITCVEATDSSGQGTGKHCE